MSTSATIAGLVGAFGAGTVIATGLKNQLDRVEKFRDRQIEAAEEFLNGVAAVIAVQASVYDHFRTYGEIDLAALQPTFAKADDGLAEIRRSLPKLSVIFNRGSLTGRVRRWKSVETEARLLVDFLASENRLIGEQFQTVDFTPAKDRRRVVEDLAARHEREHDAVSRAASRAFNRAIRRRWRV